MQEGKKQITAVGEVNICRRAETVMVMVAVPDMK